MTGRRALLDTSVIIDSPAQGIASFADDVSISAITVAELHYGVGASTGAVELLIAATALRHGYSLATRNGADLRHLERVLTVIDVR